MLYFTFRVMGQFMLSLSVFLCGFYPFLCDRDHTKQDADWNIEPMVAVPPLTDSGVVFHTQGSLGRGYAVNRSRSPLPPPYLSLPESLDAIVPLVNKELLKPSRVTGREQMPGNLKKVLLPDAPHIPTKPPLVRRDVYVSCAFSKMRVKVRRKFLGSRASPSQLSLGTCGISNQTENFFIFSYNVTHCGSNTSIINNQLVFSNTLRYTPDPPKGLIRTAVPFALPISCHYNRFHYSYKIGYLPEIKTHTLFKNIALSSDFTLTACNAQWERLAETQSYIIGSPMYFEARSPPISADQRLFISSCYATPSPSVSNALRFMMIENYGCMADSDVPGGQARFVRHRRNVVRFVAEAFLFEGVPAERLHMHCEMFVADFVATEMAKSCTYNSTTGRWEELYGDTRVCDCCSSTCVPSASTAELPATKKIVSSGSWMLEPGGGAVEGEATVEWDEITSAETKTVTEPVAATVTEPVAATVTEPVAATVTEPVAATVTEAVAATVTEPVAATVILPATRKVTRPVTRKVTESVAMIMTEPAILRATRPPTRKVTKPVTMMVTEPAIIRGTRPPTRKVTEPATRKVTEPATRKVTELVTMMVTEPAIIRGTRPPTRKVTEPMTRKVPAIRSWTDQVTKQKPVKGSAVEEAEKEPVRHLSFKEVFGIP